MTPSRLLAISILFMTTAAAASDGVLEIHYACAVNTGCFPGDTAGLPVTITQPGSYQMTSNIDYYGENTNAITIRADEVSIDMRGFRIRCRQFGVIVIGGGSPPLCSAVSGSASGILVDNIDLRHGVEVKNGSVVGMASFGVRLGWHGVARDLRSSYNRVGIQTYIGSLVEGSVIFGNDTGINQQFIGGDRDNVMYASNPDNIVGGVNLGGKMCNGALCP